MQTARTRVWSILLAFIMLLTTLPTTALAADESGRIEVGTVDTLRTAAENASNSGKTIVITADLEFTHETETIDVAAGVTVTSNPGVTITISETEDATAPKYYFTLAENAVLDGLTIQMTVDNSSETDIVSMTGTGSTVKNCSFSGVYNVSENPGTVSRAIVMNSGLTGWAITGNIFAKLRQPAYIEGTGTVSGNSVTGTRGWVVCMNYKATFENNTFSSNAVDIAIIENGQVNNEYAGQAASLSKDNNGAFVQDQKAKAEAEDGVLVVGREGSGAEYTLQAAIDAASDGDTVKLLANVDLTDGVEVDKKLTLDLNGYTISDDAENWTDDSDVDYLVAVKRGGILTIENDAATGGITTENTAILCGVKMTVKGEDANGEKAVLTVNGGTIQGYQYGISGQGTRHNTEITINGGTIRSFAPAKDNAQNIDSIAIYQPQDGTLTINGGTIQSPNTAIEIRSGRLTVTGGTITGGSGEPASTSNGSGGTTTNTGIAIAQHTTGKPIVVTITGGEITGGAAVYESDPNSIYKSNPSAEKPSISVSDGTFTGQISAANVKKFIAGGTFNDDSANNFLDDGCDLNDSGTVVPAEGCDIVIGSKGYETLADAIAEAKSGDTIELRDNVNTDTTISLPAGVTLDGNGHEITYTGTRNDSTKPNDGAFITAESGADNVTIQDVTINAGENIKHGVQFYCSDNGTLSNVTVNGGAWTSVMVNGATGVTIKDSELNPLGNAAYATIEYGMGTGVTTIPSFTLNNVTTSDPDGVKVWADNDTVKKVDNDSNTAAETIRNNITTVNNDSITISIEVTDGETPVDETVPSTKPSTGSSGTTRYNITIEDMDNGSVTSSHSRASRGTTVTLTVNPDDGYELDELIVTDANGDEIDLTRKSSTKYTFEMPRSRVTVEATFVEGEIVSTLPFDDVDVDDWFYEAVEYAYENDLMNGVSSDEFDPNGTLTRGMMVTVLYRLEGEPESRADLPFEDVEPGTWYTEAVRWAVDEGIVLGTSDTTYEPDAMITREQLATMLYRYAEYKDYDTTQGGMAIREFADYEDISDWALEGLDWAVNAELVNGVGNNTIAPLSSATRAETATLLMRFIEAFEA